MKRAQNQAGTSTAPPTVAPVASYLRAARPGLSVDGRYVVLPRAVLERLPPSLQQQIIQVLAEVHRGTARYPWPQGYRVNAVQWRPIGELVEDELREIGIDASLSSDSELVHRDRTGRRLTADELAKPVPVSTPDLLYTAQGDVTPR
jgi:hypothetical protein